MNVFANLFLLLYLADGSFSLMDELVTLVTPLESFTPFRSLLAGTVIVLAVVIYPCLAVDRRLPKRIFIPQILFALFCPFSIWLFPQLSGEQLYGPLAAALQFALGLLPLLILRKDGSRGVTLPAELFAAPLFRPSTSLIFSAAHLFLAPCALAVLLFFSLNAYLAEYTSGFMKLGPGGLRMAERIYQRDGQTIRLAAMIHVGDRSYYDSMASSLAAGRTLVLAEGVSDEDGLLQTSIDYGKMAGYLGLSSQHDMQLRGRFIEPEELEDAGTHPRKRAGTPSAGGVDILRADLDARDFRPPTLQLLEAVGKNFQESGSFLGGFQSLNSRVEEKITPEMYEIIVDDVLHRRNRTVLGYLEKALQRYDTVVIPWGALHMKGLEAEVLKRGFKLQQERERVSIDFRRLLSQL